MPMRNISISSSGTEKDFIFSFIKSVLNENVSPHTIECKIGTDSTESSAVPVTIASSDTENTAINNVFANTSSSSAVPNFWFTIDGNIKMRFARGDSVTSPTAHYSVDTVISGVSIGGTDYRNTIFFAYDKAGVTTSAERVLKYQLIFNSNVLYIVFGAYSDSFPFFPTYTSGSSTYTRESQAFSYKKVSDNNTEWMGGSYSGNYLYDSDGIKSFLVNRLNYINNQADTTAIETIQSKVAKHSSGGYKTMTMDNLWDSSYNQAVMFPVSIGNNQYVYLNNYTLMPI